jgi:hypothetical protein
LIKVEILQLTIKDWKKRLNRVLIRVKYLKRVIKPSPIYIYISEFEYLVRDLRRIIEENQFEKISQNRFQQLDNDYQELRRVYSTMEVDVSEHRILFSFNNAQNYNPDKDLQNNKVDWDYRNDNEVKKLYKNCFSWLQFATNLLKSLYSQSKKSTMGIRDFKNVFEEVERLNDRESLRLRECRQTTKKLIKLYLKNTALYERRTVIKNLKIKKTEYIKEDQRKILLDIINECIRFCQNIDNDVD